MAAKLVSSWHQLASKAQDALPPISLPSLSWSSGQDITERNLLRPVLGPEKAFPTRLRTKCELLATSVKQREVEPTLKSSAGQNLMTDRGQLQRTASVTCAPGKFQIPREQLEVIESLDGWAQTSLLPLLKPVDKCWQPQDYLPDASSESFYEDVRALQQRARELPDDYLVCLVGDMITEEALPTYQSVFNTFEGVRDTTGSSPTPWGVWVRAWTAEENRHGDLLNKYLYLSGRVDMKMVERTTQHLIGSGMDPGIDNSPYNGFIYTSFQERATFISHGNTAKHAKKFGESKLATICGMIASDEKRHEIAYTRIMEQLFNLDPSGAMIAFEEMMRKKITMPAHLMFDGENRHLFQDYASVAQRCGVYTSRDYAQIIEHLIQAWKVEERVGLSSEAQRAQDYVCNLPRRILRLEERAERRSQNRPPKTAAFSWIFNKEVAL